MALDNSLHRHLLGLFLMAAGCGEAYSDFRNDEITLQCELSDACGLERSILCSATDVHHELGECTRYRPSKANRCLEEMEEMLLEIEAGQTDLCEPKAWFDIEACDDVTRSRNSGSCRSEVVVGRPLQHDGHWVLPAVTTGNVWAEDAPQHLGANDSATAHAAAEYWLQVARTEHASVAAFARVSLELMAVGAPPHLLQGCHQAAQDEIRHARMALDVARALGDSAWDLGAIGVVPSRPASLQQVALDALLEGCIGEGGAAASAHQAADRSPDPLSAMLRQVAIDETQHAALAWATLRWVLQQDASLGEVLQQALDRAKDERLQRLATASTSEPDLDALGVISPAEALQTELDVIDGIVQPVLSQLAGEQDPAVA